MADIFISYARSTAGQAHAAAEALRSSGYSVWIDEELPTHRAYADVIAEQIAAARAVMVIWSLDAAASEWVRSEADRARNDRKLVQLRVESTALPMPFDQIQCQDLVGWSGDVDTPGWRKVLASVAELTGVIATPGVTVAAASVVAAEPILAVLPFDNLSSDAAMAAFSDGVSEEIIGALGKGVGLKVIGRSASFRFRGAQKADAAKSLKASHVLDGTVRSAGPRVRIAAELTIAATGEVVWSDRYDRDATDLFALQDEIAAKVAEALRLSFASPTAVSVSDDQPLPAPENEHRQVTVLFAEVDGFSELSSTLGEEAASELRRQLLAMLADGVEAFEGFVEKVTSAGVVALFGAPTAQEDHAQRACFAALHLKEKVDQFSENLKRTQGLEIATRMGLNSGEVIVGMVGDNVRKDYAAEGKPVAVAQRMQALAEPGSCLLSAASAALVEGYMKLDDLVDAPAFGGSAPLRIYRLAGLGSARTRLDVSRARGLSRFVGRASDLQALETALEQIRAAQGQVIGIVAEAGTGKSRLCFEFLQHCRAQGMQVYEARAVAHGRNIPFLPVLELFRAYLGVSALTDPATAREQIEARMLGLDPAFAAALPLVFDFLGVPDPDRPAPSLSPAARRGQIIGAVRQLVFRLSQKQPIVTMIEDLHWIDAASVEFLDEVADGRGARSLLLLNFRPEFHASWMGKSWYRQIPLNPLDEDAVVDMLGELLGEDPSVGTLAHPIYERTGGNPFFVEEIIQTLVETGHLQGPRGARRLVTPVEHLEVPSTVQAVLAARIDRLDKRDKRLLQVAAVIGKDFAEPLLDKVAGLSPEALKEALSALQSAEFIFETSIWPVAEYAFRHPLTQEVALSSQLRGRRRQVHAAVAEAIEQDHTERLEEQAALLATHWSEAGDARKASAWWLRAARYTMNRFATGEALTQARRGIAEAERLPEDEARCQTELDLQVLAGNALMVTAGHGAEPTSQAFARALELCEKVPASPHRMVVEYGVFTRYMHHLDLADALKTAEAMIVTGDRENNPAWRFVGLRSRELLNFFFGRFYEGVEDMRESLVAWHAGQWDAGAFLVHDPGPITLHCYASYCLTFSGQLEAARREVEASLEGARASGHHLMIVQCIFTEGAYTDSVGDADRARGLLEQTYAYAVEHDVAYFKCIGGAYLATLVGYAGQLERGLELIRAAVGFQKATGNYLFMPGYLAREGELMTLSGQAREALPVFEEALEWVDRSGARWDESTILMRRSRTWMVLGKSAAAEADLRRALAITLSQRATLCEVEIACEIAKILMRDGRTSEARKILAQALSTFEDDEIVPLLERGRKLLKSCDEPVAAEP